MSSDGSTGTSCERPWCPRDIVQRVVPFTRVVALTLVALLSMGCGGGADTGSDGRAAGGEASAPSFVVITHGQSADPFWSVVSRGVQDAGRDFGVDVQYQAPGRFSMVEMANMIDAAVASRPDRIAVSLPDADALGGVVGAALDRGVPVVSLNAGAAAFEGLGISTHVGQPEYEAGRVAGERMAEEGVQSCAGARSWPTIPPTRCRWSASPS